jgi:single-strand DNA-binding protein
MAGDTIVTITGNLTDAPDLRYTPSGAAVAKFAVASTPRLFDKGSGNYRDGEPLFMNCTAWRDLAEHAAESLAKGTRVVVTGRLKLSRWETPEGEKRSMYGLEVDDIGPSLRFATAQLRKMTRTPAGAPTASPDDPWSVATPNRPADPIGSDDNEPPF